MDRRRPDPPVETHLADAACPGWARTGCYRDEASHPRDLRPGLADGACPGSGRTGCYPVGEPKDGPQRHLDRRVVHRSGRPLVEPWDEEYSGRDAGREWAPDGPGWTDARCGPRRVPPGPARPTPGWGGPEYPDPQGAPQPLGPGRPRSGPPRWWPRGCWSRGWPTAPRRRQRARRSRQLPGGQPQPVRKPVRPPRCRWTHPERWPAWPAWAPKPTRRVSADEVLGWAPSDPSRRAPSRATLRRPVRRGMSRGSCGPQGVRSSNSPTGRTRPAPSGG